MNTVIFCSPEKSKIHLSLIQGENAWLEFSVCSRKRKYLIARKLQVGAAMQNPHSVVQQPTNRFPPPHNAAAQAGGGGAGGMMVQNVGSQPPSQVQPQVYFQQPQQQPQSQTMSNMG